MNHNLYKILYENFLMYFLNAITIMCSEKRVNKYYLDVLLAKLFINYVSFAHTANKIKY